MWCRGLRAFARPLPEAGRHWALSLGSAAMIPLTLTLWVGLETAAFAPIVYPGMKSGSFVMQHVDTAIGASFHLSGGALTTLALGDIVPRAGVYRALVNLEALIGLATMTLALGYVVTTLRARRSIEALHSMISHHTDSSSRPSSALTRHFHQGAAPGLPRLLASLADRLDDYEEGLRRYPVADYFYTRRLMRSIPRVLHDLGELIARLRWGLPPEETWPKTRCSPFCSPAARPRWRGCSEASSDRRR